MTDQPTNRPTDQPTDKAGCRVVCTRLYNPLNPLVGWLVGRSVCRSHFNFFYDFISLTSLLLPKWYGDLKNGPCPPACDFGSRVSSLLCQFFLLLTFSIALLYIKYRFSTLCTVQHNRSLNSPSLLRNQVVTSASAFCSLLYFFLFLLLCL